MRIVRSGAFALLALLAGCSDVSGPVDIFVVTYDADAGAFELAAERVETIESVAQGRGSTTRLLKEPVVRVRDDGDVEFDGGRPPNILFSESDGTVIPEDWDSLTLLSYYHHLERAVAWYRDVLGYTDVEAIVPLPSYYRLEFGIDQNVIGATDNAAYAPTAHSFLLFDAFFFQQLPLAMNDGVVTHELGHAVFHRIMNGDERLPLEYRDGWGESAVAHLSAVHEGQSDVYAAMMLGDPDFISHSLPSELADRDMRVERILTESQLFNLGIGTAEPHEIGAVIAAAIWAVSDTVGRQRAAELTFAAEQALAPDLNGSFHVGDFLGRFADAGTPAEHDATCAVFCVRFEAIQDRIPTCACP